MLKLSSCALCLCASVLAGCGAVHYDDELSQEVVYVYPAAPQPPVVYVMPDRSVPDPRAPRALAQPQPPVVYVMPDPSPIDRPAVNAAPVYIVPQPRVRYLGVLPSYDHHHYDYHHDDHGYDGQHHYGAHGSHHYGSHHWGGDH